MKVEAPVMRKRIWLRRVWVSAILFSIIALVTEFLFPQARYVVMGRLRGECFYHGLPSSFYRDVIIYSPYHAGPPSKFAQWRAIIQQLCGIEPPSGRHWQILVNDPAAVAMLSELLKDHNEHVQSEAFNALLRIDPGNAQARKYWRGTESATLETEKKEAELNNERFNRSELRSSNR